MAYQLKQASGPLFARQPNSKHCFVCGLESQVGLRLRFDDNGVDEVISAYTVPARYQGYPGIVHGGVVAAMLDEIAARTSMIGNRNRFMMTGKLDIRYRKPVPVETPLTLVGRMLRDRRRIAEAHSEIRLPDGSIAAEADITLVVVTSDVIPDGDLNALGWRVYPDEPDMPG
jgi:acyl-coenzyme A thioesterase PaaI-like protein